MRQMAAPIETLEPAEVARLLQAGQILLIDVREPSEYASERIAGAPRAYIRPCFLVRSGMANEVKRKPAAPHMQGFNWKGALIKSAIAIALFNVIAGLVTCYFILPGSKH